MGETILDYIEANAHLKRCVSERDAEIERLRAELAGVIEGHKAAVELWQQQDYNNSTVIAALRQQVAELAQNYHADMMSLKEAADREIEGLYDELMSAKNLLAFIDEISPASAAQVFEPGLTFTEACRRRMMIIVENEERRED